MVSYIQSTNSQQCIILTKDYTLHKVWYLTEQVQKKKKNLQDYLFWYFCKMIASKHWNEVKTLKEYKTRHLQVKNPVIWQEKEKRGGREISLPAPCTLFGSMLAGASTGKPATTFHDPQIMEVQAKQWRETLLLFVSFLKMICLAVTRDSY